MVANRGIPKSKIPARTTAKRALTRTKARARKRARGALALKDRARYYEISYLPRPSAERRGRAERVLALSHGCIESESCPASAASVEGDGAGTGVAELLIGEKESWK